METTSVGVEVVEQLFGGCVGVEGPGVAEVPVPEFFDGIMIELGSGVLCGFVQGKVADQNGMSNFMAGTDNGRGFIGDSRAGSGCAVIGNGVPQVAV